jgi:hypothetical protein
MIAGNGRGITRMVGNSGRRWRRAAQGRQQTMVFTIGLILYDYGNDELR